VRGIGQGRIEEAVIIFRDTKGVRFVASSLAGTERDARVVRDHCGRNHTIKGEMEIAYEKRVNYINHDINSHLKDHLYG
jgi:hypothetical protein